MPWLLAPLLPRQPWARLQTPRCLAPSFTVRTPPSNSPYGDTPFKLRQAEHTRHAPFLTPACFTLSRRPHLSGPISFYTCAFLQRPLEPQRAMLIPQVSLSCWNYLPSCLSTPFPKSNASAFSSRKSPTSTPQAHHSSADTGTRALTLPSTGANNWRSRWHLAPETRESPAHLPLQEASFLNCSRLSTPPGREERNNVIIIKPQHRHKYLFWGCFVDTMS